MKAWLLSRIGNVGSMASPLDWREVPTPQPGENEVLIKVSCCGVCHTELDEIEGRTPPPRLPVIPGHQVVGFVIETGKTATRFHVGDRVGVGWIHSACGSCMFCISGKENLCPSFVATGRDRNGGYAEFLVVHEQFAHSIPAVFSDAEAAPLLCAGAIGYRSLKLAGVSDGQTLGLTGFGASGHLVLKLARHLYPQSKIYVFARSEKEQEFARKLGASWAGAPQEKAPGLSDAIIDTTPVWSSVVNALWQLRPGARLVINAIRKESADQHALLGIRYHDHLWMEKEIKSVANITRADIDEFLSVAAAIPLKSEIELYPFEQANRALVELRHKPVRGAKVLML